MTHVRQPLTTEQALDLVIGRLKIDRAAEVISRQTAYLRAIADPGSDRRLALDDAVSLDIAYAAEIEPGHHPLLESYRLRLELAEHTILLDSIELSRHAARCARESGEACAALIEASTPGASLAVLQRALREMTEARSEDAGAIGALTEIIRRRLAGPAVPDTS